MSETSDSTDKEKPTSAKVARKNGLSVASKNGFEEVTMIDVAPFDHENPRSSNPNQAINPEISTENKYNIHVSIFVNNQKQQSSIFDLENPTPLEKLLSIISKKFELSPEKYDFELIKVLDKKINEYITVSVGYMIQPFDKFQLYLTKKDKTYITISQNGLEDCIIDTSNIKTIKQLTKILSLKMNVKNEETIKIQKFDEDFNDYIPVEGDEKYDSTKKYNLEITKMVKFNVIIGPSATFNADETDKNNQKNLSNEDINNLDAPTTTTVITPTNTEKSKLLKLLPITITNTDDEKARSEEHTKNINSILKRLNPGLFREISVEIFNLGFFDKITQIVDLIFDKAVEEPKLIQACTHLCMALNTAEEATARPNFKRLFHGAIIRKVQRFLESDLTQYRRTTIDSAFRFISCLHKFDVINFRIIENCVVVLIRSSETTKNELILEYTINLIKYLGPIVFGKNINVQNFDPYIEYLDKFRGKVSLRIEHMITDLITLRKLQWIEPSTIKSDSAGPSNVLNFINNVVL